MLISHRKRFIFLKTKKTAGTSIESYFEQYCMPEGEWQSSHMRDEYVSETGIIGKRGADIKGVNWYNHMPASRVRDLIGQEIWDQYFKFTTIRNPFDKMISLFYGSRQIQQMISMNNQGIDNNKRWDNESEKKIIEQFRFTIRQTAAAINSDQQDSGIIDRDNYLIDGKECVDYFIRFEELNQGVKYVCNHLSIPFEPSKIPEFKKGLRYQYIPTQGYYDDQTEQIVRELFSWEIKKFGYELPSL